MKILYLSAIRLPTEKAHGLQIMKTCEALAAAGAEVELIVPTRHTQIKDEPFAYYGMHPSFALTRVRCLDLIWLGPIGFALSLIFFAEGAHFHKSFWTTDVVYSRDAFVLFQYIFLGRTFVYEAHTKPTWLSVFVARRAERVVSISKGLQVAYEKRGIKKEKIILAPDGVDLDAFKDPESKEAARARLGLPLDKKIALYIGKLDVRKGVTLLCTAATLMKENEMIAIIGGEEEQVKEYKRDYPNVEFLGSRPYRELANNQAAADVLVLPNTGKDADYSTYTSPLKLFTYMASNRPIVAADVSSLREVLDENSCAFFEPDNRTSLARVLSDTLEHTEIASAKAASARLAVDQYTWKDRARRILEGLGQHD